MDFVDPLILGLLIDHVKETKDEEEWKGYFYLAILFSNNFFSSIFHAFCYQQMCIVNIQMESTLTSGNGLILVTLLRTPSQISLE